MRRARGFTLVEMLVVIGIIVIVISLLVPVISRARQSAARTHCMNNMRQLAICALHYTSDNEGQLPYCSWAISMDAGGYYGHGWLFSLPEFRTNYPASSDLNGSWLSRPHAPEDGVKTGVLWPYCETMGIYHCPLDDPDFRVGTEWLTSYLMNGAQCGYGRYPANSPGARITMIRDVSQSVMFWEALEQRFKGELQGGYPWNDGSSYPTEEIMADRHFTGANLACFDGHVEWWDPATWNQWVNNPGYSRLWCDPLTPDGR